MLMRKAPAHPVSPQLAAVVLDTLGLADTLEWHVRRYQARTGILCELALSGTPECHPPEDRASAIFDIFKEALSNVARHAGASRVAIGLTVTPHEVTVVVSDNGIGALRERSRVRAGFRS
jgi:two-component system sensor histidine kinase UhpB